MSLVRDANHSRSPKGTVCPAMIMTVAEVGLLPPPARVTPLYSDIHPRSTLHLGTPQLNPERLCVVGRNVERFRGGLVFKAHRLLHHSTLGSRVIKKKRSLCVVQLSLTLTEVPLLRSDVPPSTLVSVGSAPSSTTRIPDDHESLDPVAERSGLSKTTLKVDSRVLMLTWWG